MKSQSMKFRPLLLAAVFCLFAYTVPASFGQIS